LTVSVELSIKKEGGGGRGREGEGRGEGGEGKGGEKKKGKKKVIGELVAILLAATVRSQLVRRSAPSVAFHVESSGNKGLRVP
jgi:hypothetical protein